MVLLIVIAACVIVAGTVLGLDIRRGARLTDRAAIDSILGHHDARRRQPVRTQPQTHRSAA